MGLYAIIAFVAVSLAAVLLSLALRDAVSDCRKYVDRAMAAEVDRLNEIIARLSNEGSNAQEM